MLNYNFFYRFHLSRPADSEKYCRTASFTCPPLYCIHGLQSLCYLGSICGKPKTHGIHYSQCPDFGPHSVTVAMTCRISIGLRRFARNPNGVVHYETPHIPSPISHRRFNSSDPLLTSLSGPTYALPPVAEGTSSLIDTFMSVHGNDEPAPRTTSQNDLFFSMDTFSAGTGTRTGEMKAAELDVAQHNRRNLVRQEPVASVGGDHHVV